MDGLSCLAALEELWLCRNRFTEIGDGLPLGPTLREINVSHNRLGCFKELLKLAPLEGLRSLALQDAHFGDNPVCGLSNYKTYVAYHLTQVKKTTVKQDRSVTLFYSKKKGEVAEPGTRGCPFGATLSPVYWPSRDRLPCY